VIDLAIIGGGFWGRAVYDKAAAHGLDTVLIDSRDERSGSRNAAGICALSWYTAETIAPMIPTWLTRQAIYRSIDWLQMQWGLLPTPEHFQGPVHFKIKNNVLLLPVAEFERERTSVTDCIGAVRHVAGTWQITGESNYQARRLVIAAGVHIDTLLQASGYAPMGVKSLRGRAVLFGHAPDHLPELYTQEVSKYKHLTVRTFGSAWRVGDTVEVKPNDGALNWLTDWATSLGLQQPVKTLEGFRPVLKQFTVELFDTNGVVATGGHRVAMGLSGAVADRVLQLFGVV
jgi:glycine/D-amino acid oxidase-like deaminating enzyme